MFERGLLERFAVPSSRFRPWDQKFLGWKWRSWGRCAWGVICISLCPRIFHAQHDSDHWINRASASSLSRADIANRKSQDPGFEETDLCLEESLNVSLLFLLPLLGKNTNEVWNNACASTSRLTVHSTEEYLEGWRMRCTHALCRACLRTLSARRAAAAGLMFGWKIRLQD